MRKITVGPQVLLPGYLWVASWSKTNPGLLVDPHPRIGTSSTADANRNTLAGFAAVLPEMDTDHRAHYRN